MKAEQHAAFSLALSVVLHAVFRSWTTTIVSFLSGILLDLDHIIDYLVEHGLQLDLKLFMRSFDEGLYNRAYVVLHAWELLFLLGVFTWLTDWNPWLVGLLAGSGLHLFLDQLVNRPSKWGYFLFWRWKNNFEFRKSFPP